jgi:uncharacterized repeat protein (TIGR01451 family)
MAHWVTALVALLAVAGLAGASGARGDHVGGATYTGTHSGGGTVAFYVQPDGHYILSFDYTLLPIGCGTYLSDETTDSAPVEGDTFSRTAFADGEISYSGTFTDAQHATGTLTWRGPYCENERPTVTWQAATSSPALADLSLGLGADPDPVLVGGRLSYEPTVDDLGPMDAPGVTLTETLPAGVAFVSATASQGSCGATGDTVTCALGTIASGTGVQVTIVVVPTRAGTVTSSATVSEARQDPHAENDSASTETLVQAPCVVPNVKGRTLTAARQAIARAHCTTGRVTRRYSKQVAKGRVLSQAPAPRTRLGNSAKVNLVVSRGPKKKR